MPVATRTFGSRVFRLVSTTPRQDFVAPAPLGNTSSFSVSSVLSGLELSDTKVYEP